MPGKKVLDLCDFGDNKINELLNTAWPKKGSLKGVAFPTCVSTNNIAGHVSPLPGDAQVLVEGDVVKIDLGVQVDGYPAVVAHTIVCGSKADVAVEGRKADLLQATHLAAEAAWRLLKPGNTNSQVTETVQKIADAFKVQPLQGVLSHQMLRDTVDAEKVILLKPTPDTKVDEVTFAEGEVWAVDIVFSTGEGKARETEARTTVFKRDRNAGYQLKMAASRAVLNDIQTRFGTFPFTLRALDEKRGKLGIVELAKHGLVLPYPVLHEKAGELVAQIKFTVLILPSSTDRITPEAALPKLVSQYKIEDPKVLATLALGTKRMKKNKKNKKKKKAPAAAGAAVAAPAAAPAAAAPAAAKMDTSK